MSVRRPHSISTDDKTWEKVTQEAAETGSTASGIVNAALGQFFQSKILRSNWSVEDDDGWYDPNKFYTHTEDKNHHSAKVTMNVPKNLAGEIQAIVAGGKVPEFRSPTDFYRNALFHATRQLARRIDNDELINEVSLAMMQAVNDRVIQQRKDMDAFVTSVREVMDIALSQDDTIAYGEARLKEWWGQMSSVPEMFKKDLIAVLEEYGVKLKAVKGGGVRPIVRRRGSGPGS